MKSLALGLSAAFALIASSGCCCFWHNVHGALNCHSGGHGGCGGCDHAAACQPACESASCGGGCGQGCSDGCSHGGGCGGGCGEFSLLGNLFGYHGNSGGCSILGCGSHYLDPQGACYGADCGSCCEQAGCGCMYWGDYFNVPPTTEPCDCCQNYVGPSHSPHGSTPCYYGPAPAYHGPHHAAGPVPVLDAAGNLAEKPAAKTASPTKMASKPKATPSASSTKTASRPAKRSVQR